MSSDDNWRYIDPRSKRALARLVSMGWPKQVEIEGEIFDITTKRVGGDVYFYLEMRYAVDEVTLRNMLSSIIMRNDIKELHRLNSSDEKHKILTLDDIIPGHNKK